MQQVLLANLRTATTWYWYPITHLQGVMPVCLSHGLAFVEYLNETKFLMFLGLKYSAKGRNARTSGTTLLQEPRLDQFLLESPAERVHRGSYAIDLEDLTSIKCFLVREILETWHL
jgi:hypothetical protein